MILLHESEYILLAIASAMQKASGTNELPDLSDYALSDTVNRLLDVAGCGADHWQWQPGLPSAGWYFEEVDGFTSRLVATDAATPTQDRNGVLLTQHGRQLIPRLMRKAVEGAGSEKQAEIRRLAEAIGLRLDPFLSHAA